MAETGSFKALVRKHVAQDCEFADALLREGIEVFLSGDVETGKTLLRDYVEATVGLERPGEARVRRQRA